MQQPSRDEGPPSAQQVRASLSLLRAKRSALSAADEGALSPAAASSVESALSPGAARQAAAAASTVAASAAPAVPVSLQDAAPSGSSNILSPSQPLNYLAPSHEAPRTQHPTGLQVHTQRSPRHTLMRVSSPRQAQASPRHSPSHRIAAGGRKLSESIRTLDVHAPYPIYEQHSPLHAHSSPRRSPTHLLSPRQVGTPRTQLVGGLPFSSSRRQDAFVRPASPPLAASASVDVSRSNSLGGTDHLRDSAMLMADDVVDEREPFSASGEALAVDDASDDESVEEWNARDESPFARIYGYAAAAALAASPSPSPAASPASSPFASAYAAASAASASSVPPPRRPSSIASSTAQHSSHYAAMLANSHAVSTPPQRSTPSSAASSPHFAAATSDQANSAAAPGVSLISKQIHDAIQQSLLLSPRGAAAASAAAADAARGAGGNGGIGSGIGGVANRGTGTMPQQQPQQAHERKHSSATSAYSASLAPNGGGIGLAHGHNLLASPSSSGAAAAAGRGVFSPPPAAAHAAFSSPPPAVPSSSSAATLTSYGASSPALAAGMPPLMASASPALPVAYPVGSSAVRRGLAGLITPVRLSGGAEEVAGAGGSGSGSVEHTPLASPFDLRLRYGGAAGPNELSPQASPVVPTSPATPGQGLFAAAFGGGAGGAAAGGGINMTCAAGGLGAASSSGLLARAGPSATGGIGATALARSLSEMSMLSPQPPHASAARSSASPPLHPLAGGMPPPFPSATSHKLHSAPTSSAADSGAQSHVSSSNLFDSRAVEGSPGASPVASPLSSASSTPPARSSPRGNGQAAAAQQYISSDGTISLVHQPPDTAASIAAPSSRAAPPVPAKRSKSFSIATASAPLSYTVAASASVSPPRSYAYGSTRPSFRLQTDFEPGQSPSPSPSPDLSREDFRSPGASPMPLGEEIQLQWRGAGTGMLPASSGWMGAGSNTATAAQVRSPQDAASSALSPPSSILSPGGRRRVAAKPVQGYLSPKSGRVVVPTSPPAAAATGGSGSGIHPALVAQAHALQQQRAAAAAAGGGTAHSRSYSVQVPSSSSTNATAAPSNHNAASSTSGDSTNGAAAASSSAGAAPHAAGMHSRSASALPTHTPPLPRLFENFLVLGCSPSQSMLSQHLATWTEPAKVLLKFPHHATLESAADIADFAFPSGVELQRVDVGASSSGLHSILYQQRQFARGENCHSFVVQTSSRASGAAEFESENLYGVCVVAREMAAIPDARRAGEVHDISCPISYVFLSRFPFFELHQAVIMQILMLLHLKRVKHLARMSEAYGNMVAPGGALSPLSPNSAGAAAAAAAAMNANGMVARLRGKPLGPHQVPACVALLKKYYDAPLPARGGSLLLPAPKLLLPIQFVRPSGSSTEKEFQSMVASWCCVLSWSFLSPDGLVDLLEALLREFKIVVVDKNLAMLSSAVLSLSALVHPLRWSGVFLPILPDRMSEVLEAPVPILVGVAALPSHMASALAASAAGQGAGGRISAAIGGVGGANQRVDQGLDEDFVAWFPSQGKLVFQKAFKRIMPNRSALIASLKPHFSELRRLSPVPAAPKCPPSALPYTSSMEELAHVKIALHLVETEVVARVNYVRKTEADPSAQDKREEPFACAFRNTQILSHYLQSHEHDEEDY